ncbi:MAG: universal stress protein [Pseudomonadota bacterium]
MYNNILIAVALDHSPHANAALQVAQTLAHKGARLTALHVVEELPNYVVSQIPADLLTDRKPQAEAELVAELGGVPNVKPVVVYGHAGRTIVSFAEEEGIDCIVIASHKPGIQDLFIGSTAQRVVRHATCAVHILR